MIEDAHERTRAILWCLADANPGMPLLEALGHLKAIERELVKAEQAAAAMRSYTRLIPEYRGSHGIPNLVRDMCSHPAVVAAARSGNKGAVAEAIVASQGPGKIGATEALLAADSLVNMFSET